MAERQDVAPPWELAGPLRVRRNGRGWSFLGGWEEPSAIGLNVLLHHPENDELVKRYAVRIPVTVEDGEAVFGSPESVE